MEPLTQLRTRAVLLNGYWAAFRGSELAALRWSDAKHVKQGIEWRVRRAKNDQRGDGHTTPVPRIADPFMCPVQALLEYRQAVELHLGREPTANDPVFFALNRSPSSPTAHLSVASFTYIVNHAAEAAGLAGGPFTSHSLRSGFVTDATDNGASPEQIQRHGRWASTKSLSPYYRRANLWSDANAATKIANNFLSRNTRGVEGFK
ncbi:MAG: tyrosine-type recombinase/integrase [Candidatus Microthrix sp.]|nr:tyrosine-type recombinase/integrase [Candidatus Microthrix sp.]